MANLRDIKNRIVSVKKSEKTTRAMKMVSAAKLRKTQERLDRFAHYADAYEGSKNSLMRRIGLDFRSIFFDKRNVKSEAVILLTSDKGLCGSYNSNLIKKFDDYISSNHAVAKRLIYTIGTKGFDFFKKRLEINENYEKASFSSIPEILKLSNKLKDLFLSKEIDQVVFIFNNLISKSRSEIALKTLLPVIIEEDETKDTAKFAVDYIYEPSKAELVDNYFSKYVDVQFERFIYASMASENLARMTAMSIASKNCEELIGALTLQYNKARQASITKELLEIIGSAEAMR
ncbi:MAG: ATP synthase F1 subunit gamma [Pseudomonadota bacterium]